LNTQRIFGVALILKIGFASLGYWLGMPILFGLCVPLLVMIAYMVVGYHTRSSEISEEKFADSCYYLGFIFTIVSIVFCLFDIPKMSAGSGLQDIAVRFGAAMLSTVLGMGVRVYLVSFRADTSDAMHNAEQALLDSTRLFTAQLHENLKSLQSFEQQVVAAGQSTVAGVQVQVEAMARNFSETLSQFYAQLNDENRAAFREMADETKLASGRLAASVDSYSQGMQTHLGNIEAKVTLFADAVSARLATTEFPDDYFAKRLREPLDRLVLETQGVGSAVSAVDEQVKETAVALKATLGSLNAKLKTGATVMDSVVQMSERHQALLTSSELQAETYTGFLDRMTQIESSLAHVVKTAGVTNQASGEVMTRLAGLAADSVALRETIRTSVLEVASQSAALGEAVRMSVGEVASKLEGQSLLANGLLAKVDEHAKRIEAGSDDIVQALKGHAAHVAANQAPLEAMVNASKGLCQQLEAVVSSNSQLLDGSRKRLEGFERAAAQSESIGVSLAQIHPLLSRHVEVLQAGAAMQSGLAASGNIGLPAESWSAKAPPSAQPGQHLGVGA
jgi:hypothetical protein